MFDERSSKNQRRFQQIRTRGEKVQTGFITEGKSDSKTDGKRKTIR